MRALSRRRFLSASALAAAGALLPRPPLRAAEEMAPGRFRALRRGVGIFTSPEHGTIGWLASPDAVVVVDSQLPADARLCLAGLEERSPRPPDLLLNTHHHGDHTAGNGVFAGVTERLVAHENVPELQRQAARRAESPDEQTYATETFATRWREEVGGGETISARHYGAAHTGGDIVVHFEAANVVHLGDLVFNRWYPFIDRQGGASALGWIAALEEILARYPGADTRFVFGHASAGAGVAGTRGDVAYQRDFLSALVEHVRAGLAAGKSRDEIIQARDSLTGFDDYIIPEKFPYLGLPLCAGAVHDELTGAA